MTEGKTRERVGPRLTLLLRYRPCVLSSLCFCVGVQLLGVWRSPAPNAPPAPASGVAYYLTPPTSLRHLLHVDPLHGCGHVCVVCVVCAVMALKWVEITGADAQVHDPPD